MRAVTILQPFAELIRIHEKVIENRSWPTRHRGKLFIHAGKGRQHWDDELDAKRYGTVSWGAVIAIADLYDCVHIEDLAEKYPKLADHQHAHGPWCWMLRDVRSITPFPYKGQLGIFHINH